MWVWMIDACFGALAAASGAIVTLLSIRYGAPARSGSSQELTDRARVVLCRVHELAVGISRDVDDHTSRIEQINTDLRSAGHLNPEATLAAIEKIIQANHEMREKLGTAEHRLQEQARVIESQAAEVRTDPLTHLANRRALDEEIASRLADSKRYSEPFCLLLIDLDHFKRINDDYGHSAGDQVLRSVARALRRGKREVDIVARCGGEEFAVVLPRTRIADSITLAERVRIAIAESRIRVDGGVEVAVTASLGVAELLPGEDSTGVFNRADEAVYASKNAGRNCTHWHDGTTAHPAAPRQPTPEPSKEEPSPPVNTAPPRSEHEESVRTFCGRQAFRQAVIHRVAEWKRGGAPVTVVHLEIDRFREILNQQQRSQLEMLLQKVIRGLTAVVREMDTLARFGPGSFATMLPTACGRDAVITAERIRQNVAKAASAETDGGTRLSFSAGVADVRHGDDGNHLLARAEAALDHAKACGGDQGCYHDGSHCEPITEMHLL